MILRKLILDLTSFFVVAMPFEIALGEKTKKIERTAGLASKKKK